MRLRCLPISGVDEPSHEMGMSTRVIRLLDQVHLDIPAASEDPSWTIPHSGVPTSVLEIHLGQFPTLVYQPVSWRSIVEACG
jgi:hypothetical protein